MSGNSKKIDAYGKILLSFLLAGYFILAVRLLHFQVVNDEDALSKTVKRYQNVEKNKLATERIFQPLRGNIYSRNGKLMATTVYNYRVYADGSKVDDDEKKQIIDFVHSGFGMDRSLIEAELKTNSKYITVARRVDSDVIDSLPSSVSPKGLYMDRDDAKRIYPLNNTASHVLGYVNYAGQATGIEYSFDDVMKGVKASSLNQLPSDGADIYLTIDTDIQYFLEKVLEWGFEKYDPHFVSGIVMDPKTGEVLAMANYPDFNPNRFYSYKDSDVMINRAVAHSFEPGSSFKIVALAGALEEGLLDKDTKIDCENGEFRYKGELFRDTLRNGVLDVASVYKRSSNVGVIKIADHLGREKMFYYAKQFGFTEKKSIELPNESSGKINEVEKWAPSDLGNIAIGYGVATNLLRLTTAYAVIANEGVLPEAHIISRVRYADGQGYRVKPITIRRVISKKTARKTAEILRGVVEDGSASRASVAGLGIAGKTGTAVKYDPSAGSYDYGRVTGTFVGFFPEDSPRYVIGILGDEPRGGGYASTFVVPIFKKIAENIARYEGI